MPPRQPPHYQQQQQQRYPHQQQNQYHGQQRQGQRNRPPIVLNIAEKPSVARSLASVFQRLPGSQDKGMVREAAQIFTHESVSFPNLFQQGQRNGGGQQRNLQRQPPPHNSPHTMITTSVRGHLASQDFPADFGWSRCDPSQLFDAPLETNYSNDMAALEQMLSRLSRTVDAVILWLDCDREGEAIGMEVKEVCVNAHPPLIPNVYRATFSTVMDGEIKKALATLGRLNMSMVHAVQARSELDLRVGAAFTRFQTLRLQRTFQLTNTAENNNSSSKVISYGPCQFPTLGFVVERWARIETFRPEDFWYLELKLQLPTAATPATNGTATGNNHSNNQQNPNRSVKFSWKRQRLYDPVVTLALYESCLEAEVAVVTSLQGRPKNKWRPVPLATVELQKRASRYLRIGSETLMTAAEGLYQEGFISYPRTETERFRPEFQHRPVIQQFANLAGGGGGGDCQLFQSYATKLLDGGYQNPRAGQHDDQAHPPITPCKVVDPSTIGDPTKRGVYTLICKHYLACCSRDAMGKETSVVVKMASEEFTARGLMILHKNWLEIYAPWERWSTGQGELPPVEVGSRINPTALLMKEGRTEPPQPISEVELIAAMDRNAIGTDATIAQHISTIQNRDYAIKDGSQRFTPTPLGIALVEGYNSMGYQLNKPDLRREMEHECNMVATGQKTKEDIIGPILNKMRQCYTTAQQEAQKLDTAVARHFPRLGTGNDMVVLQANFSKCGVCQAGMSLKQERGARGRGRGNQQQQQHQRKLLFCNTCQVGWSLPRGQLRPKTDPPTTACPICQFQILKVERGEGYDGNGYHFCPKCFSDPPPEHGGAQQSNNFRCFNCTHTSCSLATGTQSAGVEVFACPFCQQNHQQQQPGKVCLKKNSRGFVLSCSNYASQNRCSYTIWLPRESHTVTIPDGDQNLCQQCSRQGGPTKMVHFRWKSGSVPPHMDRECTVCVKCDASFREAMQISLPQVNQVGTNSRRGSGAGTAHRRTTNNNNSYRSNNNSRATPAGINPRGGANRNNNHRNDNNGATGNVCYHCGQPGHFANSCPQRN